MNMNVFKKSLLLGGCVAALTLGGTHQLMAQRNFDPAQMRQDRISRAREEMKITDDKDWTAIEPLVGKLVDAQTDVFRSRMGMGRMFGGRRNRGGDTNSAATDRPQRRNSFFGEPSAAVTALQEALEKNAPTSEIKEKLAAVRAETKDKEAKLAAAEEDLRSVLTTKQEAEMVLNGYLR